MSAADDPARALYAFSTSISEQMELNKQLQDNESDMAKYDKTRQAVAVN